MSWDQNIREPAITTTDSHVENQIEPLIKWRVEVRALEPGIGQLGAIFHMFFEFAIGPQILDPLKVNIENLLKTIIDVGEEIILRPFNSIRVEALCEVSPLDRA